MGSISLGEKITTTAFARPTYVTFFYTSCVSVCPLLISNLRSVQLDTVDSGYSDDVVFLPITFDPPRDTERALRAYGNRMNVDFDVGNWHFLRPESNTRAKEAVTDTFGITYERTESSHTEYEFVHSMIILLANADGYVERVYRGARPQAEQIQTDLKTLRNRSDSG